MNKIYEYRNGTIHVTIPETCNRDELRRVTEEFLKKVIDGRNKR